MWLVIKTKQKDIPYLKSEIEKKFGGNLNIYFPKFKIECKNKFSTKNLLCSIFSSEKDWIGIKKRARIKKFLK